MLSQTTATSMRVANDNAMPAAAPFRLNPEAPEFIPGRKFESVHVHDDLKDELEAKV